MMTSNHMRSSEGGRPRTGAPWSRAAILALCLCLASGTELLAIPAASALPAEMVFATANHIPFPLVTADPAGDVRLPLSELADGAAHYYTFLVGDLPLEFFAIWTPDNVVRTAFNACDVCFAAKLGYRQEGAFMVCSNCGNHFPIERIGAVSGGCNPAPFEARLDGQELVVSRDVLAVGLRYFP